MTCRFWPSASQAEHCTADRRTIRTGGGSKWAAAPFLLQGAVRGPSRPGRRCAGAWLAGSRQTRPMRKGHSGDADCPFDSSGMPGHRSNRVIAGFPQLLSVPQAVSVFFSQDLVVETMTGSSRASAAMMMSVRDSGRVKNTVMSPWLIVSARRNCCSA